MDLPREFLRLNNFKLAFTRIIRGGNKEYKQFYRHVLPSYNMAIEENLNDLIDDIKRGTYKPQHPTVVHQPKSSGILRPLTVLSLSDLIVYQALVNRIAAAFEKEQRKHAFKRSYGAVFAGKSSHYFYRSWRTCYSAYNKAVATSFKAGNRYLADFDLVSFYELIDHELLRICLKKRVRSDGLLRLLFKCLQEWTLDAAGTHFSHGIPQGPEPSAFLAECFLLRFDELKFKGVKYYRYVDDIKLMAKSEIPLRRALLRLDLSSKELGLVPQAQKIECRRVKNLREALKTLPSGLANLKAEDAANAVPQKRLIKAFRASFKKVGRSWTVDDVTRLKFCLYRLKPRPDVLRRISTILVRRPDLSWTFAGYLKKFPQNTSAANALLTALRQDPTYDAAAANYIDAMDVCEPRINNTPYRRVINTAKHRSEEKSVLLPIASVSFRAKRASIPAAVRLIKKEKSPLVQSILLHRIFGKVPGNTFLHSVCREFLERGTESPDPDLARYCAAILLDEWPWLGSVSWRPSAKANRSVKLTMKGLGLRSRAPIKEGVLDKFFKEKCRIAVPISWRKAFLRRSDLREVERRCLRYQRLLVADPTERITYLDTFNELLVQGFSERHPSLAAAFKKAAGRDKLPNYGAWIKQPHLASVIPVAVSWLRDIHKARLEGDYAHARQKKTGKFTRPISFKQADILMKPAQTAWAELIGAWRSLL